MSRFQKFFTMVKPNINNSMLRGYPKARIPRQAQRINSINGTSQNAFIFNGISKLELILPLTRSYGPAIGIRKFWKLHLPTIKFHNDNLQVLVKHVDAQPDELAQVPVKLIAHNGTNKVEIDCKNKHYDDILTSVIEATNAKPVSENVLKSLYINV